MTSRRHLARLLSALIAFSILPLAAGAAEAAYPERPITIIVPWGAGGGTDAVTRVLAAQMEAALGVPVNVVNRTGGGGVVGHSAIATAAPDGYTLGVITAEIGMMHWVGLTDLTYEAYTPLALFSFDPAGVQVAADAPYETLDDLIAAIRDNPGELKGSGAGQGGIWHLALAGMLRSVDVDPNAVAWVPSQGAAPGLTDLVAGGVDVVPSSVVEARALMEAGRVRSLAVMADERLEAFPDVPTLEEAIGTDWTVAAWRSLVGPEGLPDEVVQTLMPAVETAFQSKEFQDFMASNGFGVVWKEGAAVREHMAESDANMGQALKAAGLAQ
ncbi:MAG: tripartite tricarboxylate transporter substrate binding protein [Geminicoccaceae bacterium]